MTEKTQKAQVSLGLQAQRRVGETVRPAAATLYRLVVGGGGSLAFIVLTLFTLGRLPRSSFLFGFFGICISFWAFVLIAIGIGFVLDAKRGTLRFRKQSGQTWISQAPFLGPLVIGGIATVATALGVYSVCFLINGLIQNGGSLWGAAPRSAWVLGPASIGVTIYAWREALRIFRANHGIRFVPDRVGLMYKHQDLFLRWDQVKNVTVATVNKGSDRWKNILPCVRIEAEGDRVFDVDGTELGSDPNVVAALMCYYLDRPQERHLLADPEAAIRRFSEAQVEQ